MATSEVSICNIALQELGATRITSLDENTRNARSCNACYEAMRDLELRDHNWNFAGVRAVLAPHATAPISDYTYAFILPTDCLKVRRVNTNETDFRRENHLGAQAILTSSSNTLYLLYTQRVTDVAQFDPLFSHMLSCRIAMQMCEEITQSNTKLENIARLYQNAQIRAKALNAFDTTADDEPEDTWLSARR